MEVDTAKFLWSELKQYQCQGYWGEPALSSKW